MTGPRTPTVHPNRQRGRLLLLFLALVLTPLACTDQPMAPDVPQAAPKTAASHQHPYLLDQLRPAVRPSMSAMKMSMSNASISAAVASLSTTGPNVLLLADADGPTTTALATSLADAGFNVGVRPAPEFNWFGTNPPLAGYEVVIHLNGATYNTPLASSAQSTLSAFVNNGGGFIGAQWNGYEEGVGQQTGMTDLVLQGLMDEVGDNCADCNVTYTAVAGQESHPVLAGIPSPLTFHADGHDASPKWALDGDPSTAVLMRSPAGGPGVIARQVGGGKVVNFGFAPNYALGAPSTLLDANVQRLYVNAARWLSGTAPTPGSGTMDSDADGVVDGSDNCVNAYNPAQSDLDHDGVGDVCDPDDDNDGVADMDDNCSDVANADQADSDGDWIGDACDERGTTPQTITFEPIADKTYGDAAFTVNASASSGLPLTFIFSGDCSMDGTTVTITAAGACTIFAQQPGNDIYTFAQDVQQSFAIAKAPQTIAFAALSDRTIADPAFTVSASASSGLAVSFTASGACTMDGATVTPSGAGSCTVTAQQAGNSNYYPAADVAWTFAITKLPATITVGTEYTYDGTIKQATVTTSPAGLSGVTVTYTLAGLAVAQPVDAGVYQVLATLDNPNYEAAQATGTLTISQATPVIQWASPAPISAGTLLGDAQLNATATGVGGGSLSGTFTYLPGAGSVLSVGTRPLSVEFTPNSGNYSHAFKSVSITVTEPTSRLTFSGFFKPVYNTPFVNKVTAGRSIPLKFAVQGAQGLRALAVGSPTSVTMACSPTATERPVQETVFTAESRMLSVGSNYTYLWKTSPAWAGSCRKLVVTLMDGSTHEAHFRFAGSSNSGEGKKGTWDPNDDNDGRDKGGNSDARDKKKSDKHDRDSKKRDSHNRK